MSESIECPIKTPKPFPDHERDELGHVVRNAWVRWANTQSNPKPSWLVTWAELPESDREADRCIGEELVAYLRMPGLSVIAVDSTEHAALTERVAELEKQNVSIAMERGALRELLQKFLDDTRDGSMPPSLGIVEKIRAAALSTASTLLA